MRTVPRDRALLVERICRLDPDELDAACRAWTVAVAC
jgi:hypothetical protein